MTPDFDDSDPLYGVSCAMNDLQWVVYVAIGAVVIAAALGVALVKRLNKS